MSITQERLKELLHYDPKTGVFTCLVSRRGRVKVGNKAGYTNHGYVRIRVDTRRYFAHRLAWLYVYGESPPDDIDHINGVRSDNRIANLRLATKAQNCQNRREAHSGSAINLLGVSPWKGKYKAQIMMGGVTHYLGLYPTIEDAHNVYLAFKRLMHPTEQFDETQTSNLHPSTGAAGDHPPLAR